MTPLLIIFASVAILSIGYVAYGGWLSKQWGIDDERPTPAHEFEDGVDYVVTPVPVVMGHHFASIAGAGPINGPIQASVFGWVPVFLWCIIGGIFFGGVHDFGSLLASLRHGGKSLGEVVGSTMGKSAKRLFAVFALLVLIMVIASFVNVVAGTFATPAESSDIGLVTSPTGNQSTAIISTLFMFVAIVYGVLTRKMGLHIGPATIVGLVGVVGIIMFGMRIGLAFDRTTWIFLIGIYITLASLVPVWILLQPRDYLSSYLLYSMMGVSFIGIIFSVFTENTEFEIPAFTGWNSSIGSLFPMLFITVACGACSGFHSLVSTGTSSKQLDRESQARIIGYGGMLIESGLGIISLIAVGMVFKRYIGGEFGSPSVAFASGIAIMFGTEEMGIYKTIYSLLTLAVSAFALTSLDTGTRLGRIMVGELFLKEGELTYKDATGIRRVLANPIFGTMFMVFMGCSLGGLSLTQIWSLFGAANQLLAGIALMAVATWLGDMGKNNRMFFLPMGFMLVATLTSLFFTIVDKMKGLVRGTLTGAMWGHWVQLIFAIAMVVLALVLIKEGFDKFHNQRVNGPTKKDDTEEIDDFQEA